MKGLPITSATASRPLVWLILALPGAYILGSWAFMPDSYGYGHAVADSGDWAAWLLLATLAVTPVRLLFGPRAATNWLLKRRRDMGVASFAYALGHALVYLWDKSLLAEILADAGELPLLTGWLAFFIFLPLAITSSDKAVRVMKRRWKKLHRLVYPAAVLTFAHWALTAFDPTTAYIHIGILAAIEIVRVALQWRQKAKR